MPGFSIRSFRRSALGTTGSGRQSGTILNAHQSDGNRRKHRPPVLPLPSILRSAPSPNLWSVGNLGEGGLTCPAGDLLASSLHRRALGLRFSTHPHLIPPASGSLLHQQPSGIREDLSFIFSTIWSSACARARPPFSTARSRAISHLWACSLKRPSNRAFSIR